MIPYILVNGPDLEVGQMWANNECNVLTIVLGSEAWEEYSSGLLGLIKDFVLSVAMGGKGG